MSLQNIIVSTPNNTENQIRMTILEMARWYVGQGISVIPVKADGSKSPAFAGWRKFADELPSDQQLQDWFAPGRVLGIGIPCGPASGNLIVLDFEFSGSSAYAEWITRLPDDVREFAESLPTVVTPSGGRHIWVRLSESQPGGKIARYASGKTKIEIRGEGHQVLAPGCPADCHATGKLYEWARGEVPTSFPEVDLDALTSLVAWAADCNEYMAPEQPRDVGRATGLPAAEDSPGNDFNRRGSWDDTGLFDAGWTWARKIDGERGFLTRPGKDGGISASVGMVSSKQAGYPYLYVWSTSTDFTSEVPFSKFAVYTQIKHAGNYSEAAKELARQGFGERLIPKERQAVDLSGFTMKLGTPTGEPVAPFGDSPIQTEDKSESERRIFKWSSELQGQAEDKAWLWKGYIAPGEITLLSASWKIGKTTLLSHLLKSFDGSKTDFLGQDVRPCRALYISEESEHHWARRRDALLLGNHVGFVCQHFKTRPNFPEWHRFIGDEVCALITKYHFDLVVVDTLASIWPVHEENDAGQVTDAIRPVKQIAKTGAGVLLIHHTRKSGGDNFVGSRGSGALPSAVDNILEFDRHSSNQKDGKRIIRAVGRNGDDVPASLLCELRDGQYIGLGDPDCPEVRTGKTGGTEPDWKTTLWTACESYGENWFGYAEVRSTFKAANKGVGVRAADMVSAVSGWFEDGELERDGEGKSASPYRFRIVK